MSNVDKAREYFLKGYNCAQAVFAAWAEEMNLSEAEALRLSSSFGGGIGGLREICGAANAMFMVVGAIKGYDMPDDMDAKQCHYKRVQSMAAQMMQECGTMTCRDLLEQNEKDQLVAGKKPCLRYVESCAAIAEKVLKEQ